MASSAASRTEPAAPRAASGPPSSRASAWTPSSTRNSRASRSSSPRARRALPSAPWRPPLRGSLRGRRRRVPDLGARAEDLARAGGARHRLGGLVGHGALSGSGGVAGDRALPVGAPRALRRPPLAPRRGADGALRGEPTVSPAKKKAVARKTAARVAPARRTAAKAAPARRTAAKHGPA